MGVLRSAQPRVLLGQITKGGDEEIKHLHIPELLEPKGDNYYGREETRGNQYTSDL